MAKFPGSSYIGNIPALYDASIVVPDFYEDVVVKAKSPSWSLLKTSSEPKPVLAYSRKIISGYPVTRVSGSVVYKPVSPSTVRPPNDTFDQYLSVAPLTDSYLTTLYNKYRPSLLNEANALLQKRLSNVKVQGLVEIGEARESIGMIRSRAQIIGDFLRNYNISKKGLYNRVRQVLVSSDAARFRDNPAGFKKYKVLYNELRNAYLEFEFGWKPLESSLLDAMKATYDVFHAHPPRTKVSAHAFIGLSEVDKSIVRGTLPYGRCLYDSNASYSGRVDVWVGGLLLPDLALKTPTNSEIFGLQLGSVPGTLWELQPYSFLIDYVSNFGSFVENLGGWLSRLREGFSYISTKVTVTRKIEISALYPPTKNATYDYSFASAEIYNPSLQQGVYFTRVPASTSDLLVIPQLKLPDWHQLLNAVALLKVQTNNLRI